MPDTGGARDEEEEGHFRLPKSKAVIFARDACQTFYPM